MSIELPKPIADYVAANALLDAGRSPPTRASSTTSSALKATTVGASDAYQYLKR